MSQRNLSTHYHISQPSEDTNASVVADNCPAIPEHPSSTPLPISSVSEPAGSTSNQFARSALDHSSNCDLIRRQVNDTNSGSNISPYDWHEGASSIGVDATEDRLLSTSFITSLLQENAGPQVANRTSYSSDAISGISEMTYPPRNFDHLVNSLRGSSAILSHGPFPRQSYKGLLFRPIGGRTQDLHQQGKVYVHRHRDTSISGKSGLATLESLGSVEGKVTKMELMISQPTFAAEQTDGDGAREKLAGDNETEKIGDDSQADTQTSSSSCFATSSKGLIRRSLLVNYHNRESVHSTRSTAPSFLSRIPSLGRRAMIWRRKPLPTVPVISPVTTPIKRENGIMDEQDAITELVNHARHSHGLLEKGHQSRQTMISYPAKSENCFATTEQLSSRKFRLKKPRTVLGIFIIIATVTIGTAVGVTVQRNKIRNASTCRENVGGLNCNLNGTCVCTSPSSSSCGNPIGQAVLDVIPVMNEVLSTNITASAVYASLWFAQGGVQGSDCVEQVNMIDVGPGLDLKVQPNRTQWTQSALLWTLTQTQDSQAVSQLRKFVQKAAWSHLDTIDGPTLVESGFTTEVAGFNYDFASQTISPVSARFVADGRPLDEQISRIDAPLVASLDRMYSYAVARSEQRGEALLRYWTDTLHQPEDRLKSFKIAFNGSPIILPFDAAFQPIQNTYNANSFPPPAACYPDLKPDQHELINAVEEEAFGLAQVNSTPVFNHSCFSAHPVYGILNVLRLRLPFYDSITNVARQGVVLKPDVAPRAILANGTTLSALPGAINITRSLTATADPRNYGTVTYANHVILQYLSTMPSNVANDVINHILNMASSATPLPPDSDLPLHSIPTLEVAVFGKIEASDIGLYVSPFTTPTGSLFFGSSDGNNFRTWAIGRGGQVAWTENATSPEVVYDNSLSDRIFNLTWAATAAAIDTDTPDVGLLNITTTFGSYGRFRP